MSLLSALIICEDADQQRHEMARHGLSMVIR